MKNGVSTKRYLEQVEKQGIFDFSEMIENEIILVNDFYRLFHLSRRDNWNNR
jgi:hypothetical protein